MKESMKKLATAYGKLFRTALCARQQVGRVRRNPRLLVLAFHRVVPNGEETLRPSLAVSENSFREIVKLVRRKFFVLSPAEIGDFLRGDLRPSSDAVLFTFDDGYADNWYQAAPVLNEAGIKAAFFITTGFVAGTHPLWWDVLLASVQQAALEKVAELPKIEEEARFATIAEEIASLPTERRLVEANRLISVLKNTNSVRRLALVRKFAEAWNGEDALKKLALPKALTWRQVELLHRQGHEIGAHTVSHADLGMLSSEKIREEITQSVLALERVTKARVRMFAYPSGMPSPQTKREELNAILSELGIEAAFCTNEGWNEPGTDPLLLSRVNMTDLTLTDSRGRFSEDCFYAVVGGFFRRGGALRRKIQRSVRGRS